jgi:hypothetical protein
MSKQLIGCDGKSCKEYTDFKKKLVRCYRCDNISLMEGYGFVPPEEEEKACKTPKECNWVDIDISTNTLEHPNELCFYCKKSR